MITKDEFANFESFKDCLSLVVIEKLAPTRGKVVTRKVKGRNIEIKTVPKAFQALREDDVVDLGDFIQYLAEEIFYSLPEDLQSLSYSVVRDNGNVQMKYEVPLKKNVVESLTNLIPFSVSDSLCAYKLMDDETDMERFLEIPLSTYASTVSAPPPEYTPSESASRPDECEICFREHLPLTYHHLIPREVHGKSVKRGWHREWELSKVAWLCRACHSYVHKIASNEQLAREFYSVDLLLKRDDIQKWALWVSKIRWKAR